VVQTHRNVLHEIMNYTNAVHIGAEDRLILLSSPSFSGTVRTIYGALLNGAGLYPLDLKEEGLTRLAAWMIRQRVTIYRSVPAIFRRFAGALTDEEKFPDLRLIYLAGDSVSKSDVELYRKYLSADCIFVNSLGLSESLTCRCFFIAKETQISRAAVPVGYAVDDMEVLLLDDAGKESGSAHVGEIAVKSRYLSPGYWRKPELTAAAFSDAEMGGERIYRTGDLGRLAPDGCLEHLGRKDFQVKIRGHRVEVGEIETALLDLEMIKEAVVVAQADGSGDQRLVAYVVPHHRPGPTVNALRRALKEKLPDYMTPAAFVLLDALPLTPNRKVDRRALPAPDHTRPELGNPFVAPRSAIEETLANIWAHVLGLKQVGVHDNFFELGGHSLSATQVISRVLETYNIELSMRSFFEAATVAAMADAIRRAGASGERNPARKISPVVR
jgi:acyl-coenzyme A synthetase/AMP-(fatty) acid ligase/acyl carrier protein